MKVKKVFTLGTFFAAMCLVFVWSFAPLMGVKTAKAEETTNGQETITTGEISTNDEVETPTVFTRLEEWFSENFVEFVSSVDLAAVAGCIVAIVLDKKSNKKNTEETKHVIDTNTAATKENTESNDKVLEVVNALIDSTNELKVDEEKRDMSVEQLLLLNRAVLEILVTVYVNNKNIPQATKDLVNMKYVAAIKGRTNETPDEVKEVSEG